MFGGAEIETEEARHVDPCHDARDRAVLRFVGRSRPRYPFDDQHQEDDGCERVPGVGTRQDTEDPVVPVAETIGDGTPVPGMHAVERRLVEQVGGEDRNSQREDYSSDDPSVTHACNARTRPRRRWLNCESVGSRREATTSSEGGDLADRRPTTPVNELASHVPWKIIHHN